MLLLTIAYSLIGFSGPDSALNEARDAIGEEQHGRAIEILQTAERGAAIRGNPDKHSELLDLRSQAFLETGNYQSALKDLEMAMKLRGDTPRDLLERRIELLILIEEPESATALAEELLQQDPTDCVLLELAGQACVEFFQPRLAKQIDEVHQDLPTAITEETVYALLGWMYLPAGNPRVEVDRTKFLHNRVREAVSAPPDTERLTEELANLRDWVQKSQNYFRRSLEAPNGEPVAAFTQLSYALRQARRWDDVVALGELYLRRFDHTYTVAAAVDIARAHFANGRHLAVIEIADRYLPLGDAVERAEAGELSDDCRFLLTYLARSLDALGRTERLSKLQREISELDKAGIQMYPELHLITGLALLRTNQKQGAFAHFKAYCHSMQQGQPPRTGADPFVQAMHRNLEVAHELNMDEEVVSDLFRQWAGSASRARKPERYLAQADHFIRTGQWQEAWRDAREAFRLSVRSEAALNVLVEAASGTFRNVRQDGVSLLDASLKLNGNLPRVDEPVCDILAAEAAMAGNHFRIAQRFAERAVRSFVWAKRPRILLATASIQLGEFDRAMSTLDTNLETNPGDQDTLLLLRTARRAAGKSTRDLVVDLVRSCPPDLSTAAIVLRTALDRAGDRTLLLEALASRASTLEGDDRMLLALLVRTWLRAGRNDKAQDAMDRVQALPSRIRTSDLADNESQFQSPRTNDNAAGRAQAAFEQTAAALELLTARASGDGQARLPAPEIDDAVRAFLMRYDHEDHFAASQLGPLFSDTARKLHELGYSDAGFRLVQPLFANSWHHENRSGDDYVLGGTLALAAGRLGKAEELLIAATSFEDGDAAFVPLILLHRAEGKDAAAERLFELLLRTPKLLEAANPPLALYLAAGRVDLVTSALRNQALEVPQDPRIATLLALSGRDHHQILGLQEAVDTDRELLLDLWIRIEVPEFADQAVGLARNLMEQFPEALYPRIVLARALASTERTREAFELLQQTTPALRDTSSQTFFFEVARIGAEAGGFQTIPRDLLIDLQEVVRKAPRESSPRMRALAGKLEAIELATKGETDASMRLLLNLWKTLPKESGAGADQARLLIGQGRFRDALDVLDRSERFVPTEDRRTFLRAWFAVAEYLAFEEADRLVGQRARRRAETILREEGAFGFAVHFLLAGNEEINVLSPSAQADLLRKHLALYVSGRDPHLPSVLRSLDSLEELLGPGAILKDTLDVLRANPAEPALWFARAETLAADGQADAAVEELRNLQPYFASGDIAVLRARLAAENGQIRSADLDYMREVLDDSILESGAGAYILGVGQLRSADYQTAAQLLAQAAPQKDGAELYFGALANLAITGKEAGRRAHDLLRELERRYPSSSLSVNVDNLVRQLELESSR